MAVEPMAKPHNLSGKESNMVDIRSKPYPPSLRRIAARIIDPATGASTCAKGNHKCTKNEGSFTQKAKTVKNVRPRLAPTLCEVIT
jgi:hypothetical protein